jgi:hypothetical protein
MKFATMFTFFLLYQQNIAQEINITYMNHFARLDSAIVLQTEEPANLMTSKYFQKIIPGIIYTLNNEKDINKNKTLLRYWFTAQQKFAWCLNHQPTRVSCNDTLCLKHNLIKNRKEKTFLHEKYGLEISGEPCYKDDTPPPLIYIPSIDTFRNYTKLIGDNEFFDYLELLEHENRKVLDEAYFKCLNSNIVCDLILQYELFMQNYPHSEFGSRVWQNYCELTMRFISIEVFYTQYGDPNRLFSKVLMAYTKYLDQSMNFDLANIVSSKFSELLNIKDEYFREKDYRVKLKYIKRIY